MAYSLARGFSGQGDHSLGSVLVGLSGPWNRPPVSLACLADRGTVPLFHRPVWRTEEPSPCFTDLLSGPGNRPPVSQRTGEPSPVPKVVPLFHASEEPVNDLRDSVVVVIRHLDIA